MLRESRNISLRHRHSTTTVELSGLKSNSPPAYGSAQAMTNGHKSVKFNRNNHRERRMSKSSVSDSSHMDEQSPTRSRSNGAKSPTRNGTLSKSEKNGRPGYDRTDTTQSGWATENEDEDEKKAQPTEFEKKRQTFITRTLWTFVMIAIFFGSMFAGHLYVIIIVTAVQIISFKEVIAISNVPSRARSLRFTKTLNWYFLGSTMYFLYGESVIYYFKHIVLIDRVLLPFATHHRFISFMLYVMGMPFIQTKDQNEAC